MEGITDGIRRARRARLRAQEAGRARDRRCLVVAALLLLGLLVLGPHLARLDRRRHGQPVSDGVALVDGPVAGPARRRSLLAFGVVLYLGPDVQDRRRRLVTPGAVVALVVWLVASGALAVYSARFGSYEKTWGTLSAVVVTLLWLWLGAAALLFGAEIDAQSWTRRRTSTHRAPKRDERAAAAGAALMPRRVCAITSRCEDSRGRVHAARRHARRARGTRDRGRRSSRLGARGGPGADRERPRGAGAREALQNSLGRVLATLRGADGLVDEHGVVDIDELPGVRPRRSPRSRQRSRCAREQVVPDGARRVRGEDGRRDPRVRAHRRVSRPAAARRRTSRSSRYGRRRGRTSSCSASTC